MSMDKMPTGKELIHDMMMLIVTGLINLFVLALFVVWFLCLVSWVGISPWPPNITTAKLMLITGVCTIVACVIIGIGNATQVIKLNKRAEIIIWGTIIIGISGAFIQWMRLVNNIDK